MSAHEDEVNSSRGKQLGVSLNEFLSSSSINMMMFLFIAFFRYKTNSNVKFY